MTKPRRSRFRQHRRRLPITAVPAQLGAVRKAAAASALPSHPLQAPLINELCADLLARGRSVAHEVRALLSDSLPKHHAFDADLLEHVVSLSVEPRDRVGEVVAWFRSAADAVREGLRDCLPVKGDALPPAYPTVAEPSGLKTAFASLRSTIEDARTALSSCLPVKGVAAPELLHTGQPSTQPLLAKVRSLADQARAVLADCLPIRSLQSGVTDAAYSDFSGRSLGSLQLGLGGRFGAFAARMRQAADEARAFLHDSLPVRSQPALPAVDARPRARAALRVSFPALRLPYSAEQRETIALLLLPFLLVVGAVAINQNALRPASVEIAAVPAAINVERSATALGPALNPIEAGRALSPSGAIDARSAETSPSPEVDAASPAEIAAVARTKETERALRPVDAIDLPAADVAAPPEVAMLEAPDEPSAGDAASERGICVKTAALAGGAFGVGAVSTVPTPESFGLKLAQAARAQADGFVIYNDKYRSISFPMGDVPSLFGVCTDVIVRAYRALGLDLQELVQRAKSGTGDRNIDHRRTEVLRRFFAAQGESLPITSFAEDYLPGDIVTYYRPQNRRTRSHIAVVSDVIAPSGRPMIVHNRGWGPQLEDALFVDQITGHYRYYGPAPKSEVERADAAATPRFGAVKGLGLVPASLSPAHKSSRVQ